MHANDLIANINGWNYEQKKNNNNIILILLHIRVVDIEFRRGRDEEKKNEKVEKTFIIFIIVRVLS